MNRSTIIQDALERLNQFFGSKQTKSRLKLYREKLMLKDSDAQTIAEAIERAINREHFFPSISTLMSYLPPAKTSSHVDEHGFTKEDREKEKKDDILVKKVLNNLKAAEEDIQDIIHFWTIETYGKDFVLNLKQYGISLKLFIKPALLDLHEADYNIGKLKDLIEQRKNER